MIEVIEGMPVEEETNDKGSTRSAKKRHRMCFDSSHEENMFDPSDGGTTASNVLSKDDTAVVPPQNSIAILNEDGDE